MSGESVTVLFFARLRESLPQAELTLPWSSAGTVEELRQAILGQGEGWSAMNDNLLSAVNQTLVSDDALVKPGDEVAFFPPVTGG